MSQMGAPELREKLFRCLKIAMSREDLSCHITNIIDTYVVVMRNPDYNNPTTVAWVDYFLKKNEPKSSGAHRLCLTCSRCGNRNWIRREDGWECAACGDFSYPENMGTEVIDA